MTTPNALCSIPYQPLRNRVARLFETPFDRRQRHLARQVAALRALSDAELAERGLMREDILVHVFRAVRRPRA